MKKNTLLIFSIICVVASSVFAADYSRKSNRQEARRAVYKCEKIEDTAAQEKCMKKAEKRYKKYIESMKKKADKEDGKGN